MTLLNDHHARRKQARRRGERREPPVWLPEWGQIVDPHPIDPYAALWLLKVIADRERGQEQPDNEKSGWRGPYSFGERP